MSLIRRDTKGVLKFTLQMILVWIFAFFVFQFFRNFGIDGKIQLPTIERPSIAGEIGITVLVGILTGLFYSALEVFFDRPFFQKISFGKLIIVKNVLYFIVVKIVFFIAVQAYTWNMEIDWNSGLLWKIMWSNAFWAIVAYFLLVSLMISFVLQVSQKFGPGMLWKFFIGKYHQPQEEERIFLFVDMKSSTTIAEELGHIRFSRLIQDCFFDLTDVISRHQVDIYQYVGDEAVLSWAKEKGLRDKRCLHAYFDFMEILRSRKDYYTANYGLQPFFKAGLHLGKVTVAEVGVIKKEIAYHGDVLNTTARIQGECNRLGQVLLASEVVIKNLSLEDQFTAQIMETPALKGKRDKVSVYGVHRPYFH